MYDNTHQTLLLCTCTCMPATIFVTLGGNATFRRSTISFDFVLFKLFFNSSILNRSTFQIKFNFLIRKLFTSLKYTCIDC